MFYFNVILFFIVFNTQLSAQEIKLLKLESSVEVVNQKISIDNESVSISDDGRYLCWIGNMLNSTLEKPSDIFFKEINNPQIKRMNRPNDLDAFVKCSFDKMNNVVASKLHWNAAKSKEVNQEGKKIQSYDTSISIFNLNNQLIKLIAPKDLGFFDNSIYLKHPRVSPNGEWITFYLEEKKLQGIYLQHLLSKRIYRLTTESDKHPTWTPDNKKILFHYEIDIPNNSDNESYIGYLDLDLISGGAIGKSQRFILDNPQKTLFKYQKHPAMITGTDLVIFHGEVQAGDKKALFVRKLKVGSSVTKLELELVDGTQVSKALHPASGAFTNQIVFIGKTKKTDQELILRLKDASLQLIKSQIN